MSTRPLKTNFILNLSSPFVQIAIALVMVPIYLHHVGDARYGVLSIVWILLGYFGFLDLGLTRAAIGGFALRDAPQSDRDRV
jgi:O-antigen/teichoic acid export membrane protein